MAVTQVVMPKLSDAMESGKVVKWLKKEGDRVQGGDILAEVETDKADVEMEAFGAGVLRKILVPAGETAPVGTLIGIIAEPGDDLSALVASAPHRRSVHYSRARKIGRGVAYAAGVVLCTAALPFAWGNYLVWAITAIQDKGIVDLNGAFESAVDLGRRVGAIAGAVVAGNLFMAISIAVIAGVPISAIVAAFFGTRYVVRRLWTMYDDYRVRQYWKQ